MFYRDHGIAVKNPEMAIDLLGPNLEEIHSVLTTLFGAEVAIADNPNIASVLIGVNVQFPFAGNYGEREQLKAYDSRLTLTAYDAIAHDVIASLTVSDHFGSSITTSVGASAVWKKIPSLEEADVAERDAFMDALAGFWANENR